MNGPEPELNRPAWQRGILAWFVQNHVAANLLMLLVLFGGVMSMLSLRQEVFPETDTGRITVSVPYRGASPEEVEQGVLLRVEEALAGVEGVKRIRSTAVENAGTTILELEEYADAEKALDDVDAAISRIDTFPEETEKPVITEATNRTQVLSIVLHGNVPEKTLKHLADDVRDDLAAMDNISQVELAGVRNPEISIEVSEGALRRHGLTFEQVADAVRNFSQDLPAGSVKTAGGEVLIRSLGQRYIGREFETVPVIARNDGTVVLVRDVATVIDGFEDVETASYFDGERAVTVNVFAIGEQDAIDVADTVKAYVDDRASDLPHGVSMDTWFDRSTYLRDRIDLLTRNAMFGLALVFIALTLFMNLRLAFWVTMGIPISFMGAFWILPAFDVTINMISLFAFIVVLGVVVDDAIVVGENIHAYIEKGMKPIEAAVRGVREMAAPVTFAVLTTIVAFLPLLFTAGDIGKIMRVIPLVVCSVLALSLVEALLILPAHLGNIHHGGDPRWLAAIRRRIEAGLHWFIQTAYRRSLAIAVRWRYATVAIAVGALLVAVGLVAGNHVKFVFFPKIDADNVVAELTMPQGTPVEQTVAVVRRIEEAAARVQARLDAQNSEGPPSIIRHINTTIGERPFEAEASGQHARGETTNGGQSHLAEVNIELLSSEARDLPSATFANLWREEVGQVAGVSSLTFLSSFFSAGDPIHIELAHERFDQLLVAAEDMKQRLANYAGVTDIDDSFLPGKKELKLSLKPSGRTLGLTLADIGGQVRQGFYGEEAQRVQRGRDDVRVMVRYPEAERRSIADLEHVRIRTPQGAEVPLLTVADVEVGRGFAEINRADRRRVVSVTADVNEAVADANQINAELRDVVLPQLMAEYPGLSWRYEGQQREQAESLQSLAVNFVIALAAIFALLGIQFRSYLQPLIVMIAIPFGLLGALLGHVLMGMDLSFLSGFGVVALTGVVVNDSLIMIDLINQERGRNADASLREVIMASGVRRFRPILLTTVTTFCGLIPMLLERSLQARFLVPMTVSLAFGVLVATAITLILVPAIYLILEDVKGAFAVWRRPMAAEDGDAAAALEAR